MSEINKLVHLLASDLSESLSANFDLPAHLNEGPFENELRKQLAQHLFLLLQNQPEQLKNILYRIDIPEQKALTAVAENTLPDAALQIAQLIIDRQKAKIETRLKFKKPPPEESELTL